MKKAFKNRSLKAFELSLGRCERIRTFDPLHPMQVRYQAAPHTESANYSALQIAKRVSGGEQVANFSELAAHKRKPLA